MGTAQFALLRCDFLLLIFLGMAIPNCWEADTTCASRITTSFVAEPNQNGCSPGLPHLEISGIYCKLLCSNEMARVINTGH